MENESQGPSSEGDIPLYPERMVNEFAYCPRQASIEWVDGEFADDAETAEGRSYGSNAVAPSLTAPLLQSPHR